jgi:arabinan endo-1,5-alpha-L-arabinosidase
MWTLVRRAFPSFCCSSPFRSTDLVHWTELGTVFSVAPGWVVDELGITPGDFWAPDISYFAGSYHRYYAASSFGTNNSVIGLATNKTLDPASPSYGWVDHGMVFRSSPADNFNAIDPDVFRDKDGSTPRPSPARTWTAPASR